MSETETVGRTIAELRGETNDGRDTLPKMDAWVDTRRLKAILKALAPIAKGKGGWNELKIAVDGKGWAVSYVDPAHVAMLVATVPRSAFESYSVEADGVFAVDPKKLEDALKIPAHHTLVRLSFDRHAGKMLATYPLGPNRWSPSGTIVRTMGLVRADAVTDPKVPTVTGTLTLTGVDPDGLRLGVAEAEKIADHAVLHRTREGLMVRGHRDATEGYRPEPAADCETEVSVSAVAGAGKAAYPLDFLGPIAKATADLGDVAITFSRDGPLKVTFVGYVSETTTQIEGRRKKKVETNVPIVEGMYLLAPRVDEEEPADPWNDGRDGERMAGWFDAFMRQRGLGGPAWDAAQIVDTPTGYVEAQIEFARVDLAQKISAWEAKEATDRAAHDREEARKAEERGMWEARKAAGYNYRRRLPSHLHAKAYSPDPKPEPERPHDTQSVPTLGWRWATDQGKAVLEARARRRSLRRDTASGTDWVAHPGPESADPVDVMSVPGHAPEPPQMEPEGPDGPEPEPGPADDEPEPADPEPDRPKPDTDLPILPPRSPRRENATRAARVRKGVAKVAKAVGVPVEPQFKSPLPVAPTKGNDEDPKAWEAYFNAVHARAMETHDPAKMLEEVRRHFGIQMIGSQVLATVYDLARLEAAKAGYAASNIGAGVSNTTTAIAVRRPAPVDVPATGEYRWVCGYREVPSKKTYPTLEIAMREAQRHETSGVHDGDRGCPMYATVEGKNPDGTRVRLRSDGKKLKVWPEVEDEHDVHPVSEVRA